MLYINLVSTMSKNIETGRIKYVPLYWIQAKFTTL